MTNPPTIAMHADVKIWPQLLPFKRPASDASQLRFFVAAVFVSMVIHVFLVYLSCVLVANRETVVESAPSSTETPLIVSLISLPTPVTDPHDGLDSEVVSALPYEDPPDQRYKSPLEHSRSIEHKSESEPLITSKDFGIPGSATHADKSFTIGTTPPLDLKAAQNTTQEAERTPEPEVEIDLASRDQVIGGPEAPVRKSFETEQATSMDVEAATRTTREVVRIPEFEAGLVLTLKDQWHMGSEAPADKSHATGATPSIDLEAAIAQEVGILSSMTEIERQEIRELYLLNRLGIIKTPCPDCVTDYADTETSVESISYNGLLALPFLIKDIITDKDDTLDIQERLERRLDLGRLKDQEKLEFMSNLINELTFDPP